MTVPNVRKDVKPSQLRRRQRRKQAQENTAVKIHEPDPSSTQPSQDISSMEVSEPTQPFKETRPFSPPQDFTPLIDQTSENKHMTTSYAYLPNAVLAVARSVHLQGTARGQMLARQLTLSAASISKHYSG